MGVVNMETEEKINPNEPAIKSKDKYISDKCDWFWVGFLAGMLSTILIVLLLR